MSTEIQLILYQLLDEVVSKMEITTQHGVVEGKKLRLGKWPTVETSPNYRRATTRQIEY